MARVVAGSLLLLLALGCSDDDGGTQEQSDGGRPAPSSEMRPFGAPCTDSSQCEYLACVEVAAGRTVCSGGCTERRHCPVGPNWDCLRAPDLGSDVHVCGCLSDSPREICGDGLDNDCDTVIDCAPPDDGGAGEQDAAVDGGADAGECPEGGCEPVGPPSCATDPGLCPACGSDADCDDDVACTEDHCRARGCVHVPRNAACADSETCDPRAQGCVRARACAGDADCVDDDACTQGEHCDMAAAVCRFVLLDGDADEHYPEVCGGDDCDDTDATRYPGALDVCDGADNDCNGSVDPQSAALLCGPGRVCSGGTCACAQGTMACRGRCLADGLFQTDVHNCGTCGNECAAGRSCSDGMCEDVDECAEDPDRCGPHASCMNTVGSFVCDCDDGWGTAVGGGCADVNECYAASDDCDSFPEACVNTEGGYSCECPDGYSGDGVGVDGCADVDECAENDDDCGASELCINQPGGFACSQTARQVHAFGSSTCAVRADFSLKCWGDNGYGQLGLGDPYLRGISANQLGENLLAVSLGTGHTARSVTGGVVHACALLEDFSIKCWGTDYPPVLGLESQTNIGDDPFEMGNALPAVALGTGLTAKAVVAGSNHTCAILEDDSVKCWGSNDWGQLGLGNTDARSDGIDEMGDALPAVALGTDRTAKALALGDTHTCALLDDDSVKCWGYNGSGALGQGDVGDRGGAAGQMGDALQPVALGANRTAKAITARGGHTCALLDNDTVKCWGYNGLGQLGLGDGNARGDQAGEMGDALPAVQLGNSRTAKAIAAGANHTCALLDNDTVKCWGYAAQGQLGQGNTLARGDNAGEMGEALQPISLGQGRTAQAITAGESHSCALLDDGSIKCWGWNGSGQLGVGDTEPRGDNAGEMGDALPAVDLGP